MGKDFRDGCLRASRAFAAGLKPALTVIWGFVSGEPMPPVRPGHPLRSRCARSRPLALREGEGWAFCRPLRE